MTVVFKDLEITDGKATDGGVLGGTAALGGGMLIDDGDVTLSSASVRSNSAAGVSGVIGASGAAGKAGGDGTQGESAGEAASTWPPGNSR